MLVTVKTKEMETLHSTMELAAVEATHNGIQLEAKHLLPCVLWIRKYSATDRNSLPS